MDADKLPIALRAFNDISDLGFVYNSYLKSFRGSLINKKVSNSIYYKAHQRFLTEYIQKHGSSIIMAVNPESPDQIYGYCIYNLQLNEIFFAYSKEAFRKLSIFKSLLEATKIDITKCVRYRHDTYSGCQVVSAMPSIKFEYFPFYCSDDSIEE